VAIYTYRCPEGHTETRRRLSALRDVTVICGLCDSKMKRDETESFSIGRGGASKPPAPQTQVLNAPMKRSGVTAILAINSGFELENCDFKNLGAGINMDGGGLDATNLTFENNHQNIKAKNAIVRLRDTKSK
jgi:hypothetical protein